MTRDPETIKKAIITLDEMIELEKKQIETQGELRRALLLAYIAPGVFEGGKVKTRVEGGLSWTHTHGDVPSKQTVFIITPERGEEVSVPLYEVPLDLWPFRMRQGHRYLRRERHEELEKRDAETWRAANDVATA